MKPMKPRQSGGPHEALAELMQQIADHAGEAESSGVRLAADFEGVSPFTLYKQLDPDDMHEMPFTRVWRLSTHFQARAIADRLADQVGCKLIALPETRGGGCDEAALLKVAKEATEVIADGWAAKADGHLDRSERQHLRRQVKEALVALLEFDGCLAEGDR